MDGPEWYIPGEVRIDDLPEDIRAEARRDRAILDTLMAMSEADRRWLLGRDASELDHLLAQLRALVSPMDESTSPELVAGPGMQVRGDGPITRIVAGPRVSVVRAAHPSEPIDEQVLRRAIDGLRRDVEPTDERLVRMEAQLAKLATNVETRRKQQRGKSGQRPDEGEPVRDPRRRGRSRSPQPRHSIVAGS